MKLISLNIEGTNHHQRFLPFLKREQPEVVCLQEVFASDLPMLERELGLQAHFAVTTTFNSTVHPRLTSRGEFGVAIFTALQPVAVEKIYYVGNGGNLPVREANNVHSSNRVLLYADFSDLAGRIRIATTHFTWSPDGKPNEIQREHFVPFAAALERLGDFVLVGDLNCPRGTELWQKLSANYHDNIPSTVLTTLDPELHHVKGRANLVVDCLFSTGGYDVRSVRVVSGLSDHQAIVGEIRQTLA